MRKRGFDARGMSLEDQMKLLPHIKNKKYQITVLTQNGKTGFLYLDDEKLAEIFCRQIKAKILKIIKL